jgi:hypothetical protein
MTDVQQDKDATIQDSGYVKIELSAADNEWNKSVRQMIIAEAEKNK